MLQIPLSSIKHPVSSIKKSGISQQMFSVQNQASSIFKDDEEDQG